LGDTRRALTPDDTEPLSATSLTSVIALYDELVLAGEAPDPGAFAARHPEHPELVARLAGLERLRADLGRLLTPAGDAEPPPVIPGLTILRPLARGGMGVVYAARQERPRRLCAVKVIAARYGSSEQRFEREADLAGRLSHPGIATVYSYGTTTSGRPYLVTELVHGFSLRALLQVADLVDPGDPGQWLSEALRRLVEGPSPAQRPGATAPVAATLALGVEIALALGHAHDRGVVHRDVKPSNVMIGLDGHAKLVDFGIAVPLDAVDARVTVDGTFVGSLAYAPPEQVRGELERVGPWTDTFALGATLFEMLTQRPPFGEATFAERLAAADRLPARSPRQLDRAVPAAVDAVIMRALAPNPGDRFADGHAFAAALRRAAGHGAVALGSAPFRLRDSLRSRRSWLSLAAVIVLALAVAVEHHERVAGERRRDDERARAARSLVEWVLARDLDKLAACFDYRPVPLRAPRAALRLELSGRRISRVDVLPRSRDVLPTARACLEATLRSADVPPALGDEPVTVEVEADLPLDLPSAARE